MIKFVTHLPCNTAIELRARAAFPAPVVEPWCPRCRRFVDLHTLSSTGPFSAVVRRDEPVLLQTGATDDRETPVPPVR